MTRRLLAAIAVLSAAGPGFAQDRPIGQITAYNLPEIRAFSASGQPLGPQPRSALPPLPAPIVETRGSTYGIRRGSEVIFVRGIDVQLQLDRGDCPVRTTLDRRAGEYRPGVDAGSGSADDCRR